MRSKAFHFCVHCTRDRDPTSLAICGQLTAPAYNQSKLVIVNASSLLAVTYLEKTPCVSAIQRLYLRELPGAFAGIDCARSELVAPSVADVLLEAAKLVANLLIGRPRDLCHHALDCFILVRFPLRTALLRHLSAGKLAHSVLLAVGEVAIQVLVETVEVLVVLVTFLEEAVSEFILGKVEHVATAVSPCFKHCYLLMGEDAAMLFNVLDRAMVLATVCTELS